MELKLVREGDLSSPLVVTYATSDGSATAGEDDVAACSEVSFAAGESTKTLSVAILNDTRQEVQTTIVRIGARSRNPNRVIYGIALDDGFERARARACSRQCQDLDLDELSPASEWNLRAPMVFQRRQHNATVLPDGRILVTGGCSGAGFSSMDSAVTPAEIYDGTAWRVLPAALVPRCYHSFALLLADGSVLTGGGGEGAGLPSAENIFKRRPKIQSIPAQVAYDESFVIQTDVAVARVTAVRLAAVTHSFDQNQRFVEFPPGAAVTVPGDGWVPPGDYLFFVIDAAGVPSEGKFVRVGSPL